MSEEVKEATPIPGDSPEKVYMSWTKANGDEVTVEVEEIENGYIIIKNNYKSQKEGENLDWDARNDRKKYYSKEKPEIMEDVDLEDFIL